MKLVKITMAILFISLINVSFGQKVKIAKDVITIDKEEFGKIEDDKAVRGSFYLNDLNDNNLLYFKWVLSGSLNYFEIYRADNLDTILYEEEAVMGFRKYFIKKLFNAKAFVNSGIDSDKLDYYAKKMGKEFSRTRSDQRY